MDFIATHFERFAEITDGNRAIEHTARVLETDRLFTYPAYRKTAEYCAAELRRCGLQDVTIVDLESTGQWGPGGWVLPKAWDCQSASLSVVKPEPIDICRYPEQPICLVQHSAPTSADGLESELVRFESGLARSGALAGKVVFTHLSVTAIQDEAAQAGVLGIVSDFLDEFPGVRSRSAMPDAHRWVNDAFKPCNDANLFGFSLNQHQGQQLDTLLDGDEPVYVRVAIDSCLYDDSIGVVTGLIPGETEEEVLVIGHLYEVGALDNGSGTGLILELARNLCELRDAGRLVLKRGIRFLHTFEMYGTFGFFQEWGAERTKRIVGGLNLDALGGNQERCRCPIVQQNTPAATPSYVNTLLRRIVATQQQLSDARPVRETSFYETVGGDNHCADPMIGVQCASLWMHPSRHWHTSEDSLDTLDPRQTQQMGQVALSFLTYVAQAGDAEAAWLASEIEADAVSRLAEIDNVAQWQQQRQLAMHAIASLDGIAPRTAIATAASERLRDIPVPTGLSAADGDQSDTAMLRAVRPRRTSVGATSGLRILELLPMARRLDAKVTIAAVTDNFLAAMLHWSDGQRTLEDVYNLSTDEIAEVKSLWSGNASDMMTHELAERAGRRVAPEDALAVFQLLADLDLVVLEPTS